MPYSNDFWSIKLYYIELVLSQKEIIQSLLPEEKLELLLETKVKFYEKVNDESFLSLPGLQSSVRIMAGILDLEEYPELNRSSKRQMITRLILTGVLDDASMIDEILIMSNNFITNKKQTK